MNKELFDSMQEQMKPAPEVRAALSEKLAQPAKKRPVPWRKYGAVAACAALVIGVFSIYHLCQDHEKWMLITRNFQRNVIDQHLHSYTLVEDSSVCFVTEQGLSHWFFEWIDSENTIDTGAGAALSEPSTGDLSSGAYVGDIPVQEGTGNYQRLMAHFNGSLPDWYGGAYLDSSGWLVVKLVEDKDPGDKSLELQVQDWAGSDTVMFASCKYSLAHLNELMDQLNQLPDTDPKCGDIMAGWGVDEKTNRIELTLTDVNDHILNILFQLDPEEDAIYVQVGQPSTFGVSHDIQPGGTTVPIVPEDDKNLTATEPYYDVEHLPEELPEQKQPAITVQSASEDASTASRDLNP